MSKDLTAFRAVETLCAIVLVWALYLVISSGALSSLNRDFGDWYSSKVSGIFAVDVIDTSIRAPQLDRASLPLASDPQATAQVDAPVDNPVDTQP